MADPVSIMAVVGMGATVAGGLTSAMGSAYQGQAQSNMYTYQAGVADVNKKINLQNADYARATGEVEAQQSGMRTGAQIGTTKAVQGASGLDVNRGSNVQVRDSELAIGQENEGIIRSNAAKKAYGFDVEATQNEAQAGLYRMGADTSKTAAGYKVAGSLISTASSVASKWTQASSAFGGTNAMVPSASFADHGMNWDG